MKGEASRALTEAQIDEIVRRVRKGDVTIEQLAADYNVSTAPIRNALKMRGIRTVRPRTRATTGQALKGRIS